MNFNAIVDRLSKVQRVQRLAAYGATILLVAVGVFFLVYLPTNERLSASKAEQQTLRKNKIAAEQRVANAEQFRTQLDLLNEDLKQALRELPNAREVPGLVKNISALGKKAGLEVRRFEPLDEQFRDYVAEVPVSLQVRGDFHNLAGFFDRLSKMNRIVYVKDIEIGDPEEAGGKVLLTVEGTAVTFRFLNEDERETVSASSKGKSKSKRGRGRRR